MNYVNDDANIFRKLLIEELFMSGYAAKLSSISEKKKKLIEEEQNLIETRKKEIGQLAQKMGLLTVSDELISGLFTFAQKSIADKADCVKEWETLGGRFRKKARTAESKKNVSASAENKAAAVSA